jgi:hypothetical protein
VTISKSILATSPLIPRLETTRLTHALSMLLSLGESPSLLVTFAVLLSDSLYNEFGQNHHCVEVNTHVYFYVLSVASLMTTSSNVWSMPTLLTQILILLPSMFIKVSLRNHHITTSICWLNAGTIKHTFEYTTQNMQLLTAPPYSVPSTPLARRVMLSIKTFFILMSHLLMMVTL